MFKSILTAAILITTSLGVVADGIGTFGPAMDLPWTCHGPAMDPAVPGYSHQERVKIYTAMLANVDEATLICPGFYGNTEMLLYFSDQISIPDSDMPIVKANADKAGRQG